ncbi:efflux RND transporter permease subunit [Staphylococcus canis]|uniref:Efflux RND transporter permease subunit n=1 Tax=Staphylococcus canis TaxID=2724942 RepID=A0ABS0T7B7_9STAP|nr:efflux RND transporter permease subunit [Staphylococcus canis]MBI5974639.1 efflux RND transporter permease subunit [Staphylococcus canis]
MIKKLIDFSLSNKFAVMLMVLLVIIGGIYSSFKMRLELLPDVEPPTMTIATAMPGATPETVMKEVSDPIDDQIRGMADVESVKTESLSNVSLITINFDEKTNLDDAEQKIQKTLSKINFDDQVEEPDIQRNSMNAFPVVAYSVLQKDDNVKEATSKVKNNLIPKLQTIDGVQNVNLNGQTERKVSIQFNQEKLQGIGLNEKQVTDYIEGATKEAPLGLFQFGDTEKSVIVDGQFTSVNALKDMNIPVTALQQSNSTSSEDDSKQNDQPESSAQTMTQPPESESTPREVKLSDIAQVKLLDERDSISRTNGKEAVDIQVIKAQDANTVAVANKVDKVVNDFIKDNKDLKSVQIMDTAKPIQDSLNTMIEKALLGSIVAIIVIMLFLRNIRMTAIALVSIPMSLLIAMMALKLTDVSLNILTLGALTVAVGRVIDDSIVVIENIYRRLNRTDEPLSGEPLIVSATKEVFIPIMSSTLVTIVVFAPLAFVTGSVGQMFRPFAYAVSFSLLASLLISITVVPMLGSVFFKKGLKKKSQTQLGVVGTGYRKVLNWSLNHKWIVLLLSTLLLVGVLILGVMKVGTSFISTGEDKFMALTYTAKPGETEAGVLKNAEQVDKYLQNNKYVKNVQYSVGGKSPIDPTGDTNNMALMVEYASDTPNFDEEPEKVLNDIDRYHHKGEWQQLDIGTGGMNNALEVKVTGPSTKAIEGTVKSVEKEMKTVNGLTNVKSDLTETYEEYRVKVDSDRASRYGVTAGQLALLLNQNIPEVTVSQVKDKQHTYDVVVKHEKETHWTEQKLKETPLPTPVDPNATLSDIASIEKSTTPNSLVKEGGDYTSTVTGQISGDDVGAISQQVLKKLEQLDTPSDVHTSLGGTNEDIQDAFSQLAIAMLAAIIIVYLVLVLTFKGALAPFTILFSLPYTVIGVVLALIFTGETLSVPSMIGVLMLIGIVVTNAIVLIDRVITNERQGLTMKEALLEAGGTRIRPILMTAIATIGALIPLLFGQDSSILISKGLAATVIGGLLSSTLLTLIVVPVIYEILFTLKRKMIK